MALFDQQKSSSVKGLDLSRKGSIDDPIVELTKFINEQENLFTLSSCSGRIVMLRESPMGEKIRKSGCEWILVSHKSLGLNEVLNTFNGRSMSEGCVVLKFEPFVLHVQCRNISDAQNVHSVAINSGFRNSGLSIGKSGKIVAAVRSTHGLEVPLTDDNGLDLVNREYIEYVLRKANDKLAENLEKIIKFENLLRKALLPKSAGTQIVIPEVSAKAPYMRKNKKRFFDTGDKSGNEDLEYLDSFIFPES